MALVWLFIAWLVLATLINVALNALLDRLGPAVIPLAGDRLTVVVVVVVIGLVLAVQGFAHAALNLFTFGSNAIGIVRAYMFVTDDDRLVIPADALARDAHHRRARWAIAAVAAAFLIGASVTAFGLLRGGEFDDRVTIVAHRGSSMAAPENTLAAIDRAIEDGADYAEIRCSASRSSTRGSNEAISPTARWATSR
jgi:glycerophosphoryl diester phosphodiesterase